MSGKDLANCLTKRATLKLADRYYAESIFYSAADNYKLYLHSKPNDRYATYWLGMALYEQRVGENDAAQNRYNLALKLAPQNATVLNNYGAFLCSLGQYVSAQQQFAAAAQATDYGQVADSLENAGYCFFKAGQNDEARVLLGRALKYDPDKGVALLAEADRQFSEGKGDKAKLLLDVYQHILPATAESLWLQIRFAALAGRHNDLQRYGTRLARSFPQSKQYQQFLANEY